MSDKDIVLANVDERLCQAVTERAQNEGKSAGDWIVALLRQHLPKACPAPPKARRDLSHFVGTWTREEAEEFDCILAEMDGIAWGLDRALSRALHDRAKREDKPMGSLIAELLRDAMDASGESEA